VRVSGDDSYVLFVKVETKAQLKQLTHTDSPVICRKLMATVFFDRKGVLIAIFMLQWATAMSEVYC
jgi:hypothetical protein